MDTVLEEKEVPDGVLMASKQTLGLIRGAAPKETAPLEGLYNFPKGRRGFFFLREAADNILPGDNADKAV